MTDRLKGCLVVFDRDLRDDDAQPTIDAIRQLRGVSDVTTSLATPEDALNRLRMRRELINQIYELLK